MRKLLNKELDLLYALARGTPAENAVFHAAPDCRVVDMRDGRMRSIRFVRPDGKEARFGREVIERRYIDDDGITVSIGLNVDKEGLPFEIDLFKGDGQPLRRYPQPGDLVVGERKIIPPS